MAKKVVVATKKRNVVEFKRHVEKAGKKRKEKCRHYWVATGAQKNIKVGKENNLHAKFVCRWCGEIMWEPTDMSQYATAF